MTMTAASQVVLGLWFCALSAIFFMWDLKLSKHWRNIPTDQTSLGQVLWKLMCFFILFWACVMSAVIGIRILGLLLNRLFLL